VTPAVPRHRGDARLRSDFFDRPVLDVAPQLLGCTVSHAGVTVRLTEVEAYDGADDPGSHAFRGRSPRVEVMFGPPGGLYVYFTYGMHYCMNLVCGPEGTASAVLLRAGQVVEGLDTARSRRGSVTDRDLARGPARLTRALGVGRAQNGVRTTDPGSPVVVRPPGRGAADGSRATAEGWRAADGQRTADGRRTAEGRRAAEGWRTTEGRLAADGWAAPGGVGTGGRVGVSGPGGDGTAYPWRFFLEGEPTVSAYRPAKPRARRTAR